MWTFRRTALAVVPNLLFFGASGLAIAVPGETELVSVAAEPGEYSDGPSNLGLDEAVSGDGRFVVFHSNATNLLPGADSPYSNVFVRDRLTGNTEQVDVGMAGAQPNGDSSEGAISVDGRYVAFYSEASNLVPGDTNGWGDIFVRDRWLGTTQRVSVDSNGTQSNGLNARTNAAAVISLSDDGRFVAFYSAATNLVPDDTNSIGDIFVRDRQAGTTERVNLDATGAQLRSKSWGNMSLSGDGRFVAFSTSANGVIPGDSSSSPGSVYVRDRLSGQVEKVSVSSAGVPGDGLSTSASISADGRYVAFWSGATNLVPGDTTGYSDIFVRDRANGTTELVTVSSNGVQANYHAADDFSISADGRFVVFSTVADNLVPSDLGNLRQDMFIRDRQTKRTLLISVPLTGAHANRASYNGSVSSDGSFVVFASAASNLVPSGQADNGGVFLREMPVSPSPTLAFTLKPSALAFGDQALLTSRTQSFWLRNTGTAALPIEGITLRGVDRAMFSVAHNCGSSVAFEGGCKISVTFRPTTLGAKSAALRVVAGNDAIRIRELTGTGVAPGS